MELRGWDTAQKQEFLTTVKAQAEIHSGADLQNFAKGVLLKDSNVTDIEVASDTIKVSYNEPAKLFGLFGGNISANVEADSGGRVKVKYPWYAFLYKIPKAAASAELETKLETQINANLPDVSLRNSIQVQAQTIATISSALKDAHDSAE